MRQHTLRAYGHNNIITMLNNYNMFITWLQFSIYNDNDNDDDD